MTAGASAGPAGYEERRLRVGDVDLVYFERHQGAAGPTLLLVHATGFHARCWDGVLRALDEMPGATPLHTVAVDMRGHGRSDNHARRGEYHWGVFGDDLSAFVEAVDLEDILGVGHSMGGHAIVQAAARLGGRFDKVLLVDPVIRDPEQPPADVGYASAEDHPVSRRRGRWASVEAMVERFAGRKPFKLWDPAVLQDYCRYGLLPTADGDLALACPPLVEASIYLGSAGWNVGEAIARIDQPVVVLRARHTERTGELDFSASPTWPQLASAFANGVDVYLPHLTHFIPMQRPDLVAEHIRALADPGD